MPPKGYCTAGDVSDFLGVGFTSAQETHALKLIEDVEIEIDRETRRGWLVGPQAEEFHYFSSFRWGKLYLRYAPVETIDEIRGRAGIFADEVELVEGEDYEIADLQNGLLRIFNPGLYERISVDYTPINKVPPPIRGACTEWVAAKMQPHLRPDTYGLDSYSLPDITVKFSRAVLAGAVPPSVRNVLDLYRWP